MSTSPAEPVQVRAASAEEVIDLRHAVLRPGQPREAAMYDVDVRPATRHFVATIDGAVVGCVTIFPSPWRGGGESGGGNDETDPDAWQLRGMGVAPDVQSAGVGRKLLEAVDAFLRTLAPPPPPPSPTGRPMLVWCNARVTAMGFYQRCGWTVASEVFDLPPIGPHVKMTRRV